MTTCTESGERNFKRTACMVLHLDFQAPSQLRLSTLAGMRVQAHPHPSKTRHLYFCYGLSCRVWLLGFEAYRDDILAPFERIINPCNVDIEHG